MWKTKGYSSCNDGPCNASRSSQKVNETRGLSQLFKIKFKFWKVKWDQITKIIFTVSFPMIEED